MALNKGISNGGNQPPRNKIVVIADIKIMLAYSPKKNSANDMEEYSTLKPPTSSLSPSGKSNGARLVSANPEIKNTMNMGNNGTANHICVCARTMVDRFSEPASNSTVIITRPMDT